jgi:hypothetical protein
MQSNYYGIEHNHSIIEPTDGQLFHPECDPRLLQESCPACAALMADWDRKNQQMIADGV